MFLPSVIYTKIVNNKEKTDVDEAPGMCLEAWVDLTSLVTVLIETVFE